MNHINWQYLLQRLFWRKRWVDLDPWQRVILLSMERENAALKIHRGIAITQSGENKGSIL